MAQGWRGQYYRYKDFFLNVMNLYKKRSDLRAFLEIILSITTVIIFFVFALRPTALTIVSLYNEIQKKEETVDLLDIKLNDLETASAVYIEQESAIPAIENSVATGPKPDLITKQIQALGSQNSVTVMGVSIGQVTIAGETITRRSSQDVKKLPEDATGMPISISVRGSYTSLVSFIKGFENLRVATVTDIVGINTSLTEEGSIIVVVISGRVPFLEE